jgi:alcohol dehydrogenase
MNSPENSGFFSQARIMSGLKALENIPLELEGMSAGCPLVITDGETVRKGLLKKLINSFSGSPISVGGLFDGVVGAAAQPETVEEVADLFRRCRCDSIIAVGTGAVVNTAKGVNILLNIDGMMTSATGNSSISKSLLPLVAVPTAPFRGYETSNEARIGGFFFRSDYLYPDIICMDPRMLKGTARGDSAISAATALTHALEALMNDRGSPVKDSYAHAAVSFVNMNLKGALNRPSARGNLLALANASVAASVAYSNSGPGLTHHLSRALSAETGMDEAEFMALLLPSVVRHFFLKRRIAGPEFFLGLLGFDRMSSLPLDEIAIAAVERTRDLCRECWRFMPGGPVKTDFTKELLKRAAGAAADADIPGMGVKECMAVLETAGLYKGE